MKMDIYEPFQQVSMWGGNFKVDGGLNSIASPMLMVGTNVENKVRKCDFYFFCWVNFFFMWNLDYKSYNSIFWIWILQSEDIPQESREPSGSGADQEATNKEVNKVMKFLQDISLLRIYSYWNVSLSLDSLYIIVSIKKSEPWSVTFCRWHWRFLSNMNDFVVL